MNEAEGKDAPTTVGNAEDPTQAAVIADLQRSSSIDMTKNPEITSNHTVYVGNVFSVDDTLVRLTKQNGEIVEIKRQIVRHHPAVVLLVHDCARDLYLLEREYRGGSNSYAFGIPAGLIDEGEDPLTAAFRELHEETGVTTDAADVSIDEIGSFYSSEGMGDELVTIMVMHLHKWEKRHTHFDDGEYVESTWVNWEALNAMNVRSSNSVIALKHEALRRLTKPEK
ncbi:MAG: NUDIX hydrolase [Bifidobacteriaceae bacterium]|jgi:8-oxo-dGTP pyrophosphatase MutT (NUDIX family)|nr:NUDIX hydrolase [Bifidobacteriaceae bacterium]MCI1979479.1 NUDIX hydrolase [Bifidobacteriaceae bacterium]